MTGRFVYRMGNDGGVAEVYKNVSILLGIPFVHARLNIGVVIVASPT